ncbi:hypothetical protein BDV30DRAFT_217520 [Aspergillus minisclerotigenes]|uniref:Uncharacterized protein n=1 Tax=Aspergillus minisclerotigenes TaxID=656917 RepID=A0A5N6IQM4_9EURO|nr:hypothetical protein BDV30DRAFT_217520 [Aspergillus minisclerotigenes]
MNSSFFCGDIILFLSPLADHPFRSSLPFVMISFLSCSFFYMYTVQRYLHFLIPTDGCQRETSALIVKSSQMGPG